MPLGFFLLSRRPLAGHFLMVLPVASPHSLARLYIKICRSPNPPLPSEYTFVSKLSLTRDDIKNQLNMELTVLLYQNGYPPEWDEEVFEKVMEQAENFKKYSDK